MISLGNKYKFYILPHLTIYDYKSIEDNLTSMAAKGWGLKNTKGFIWIFEKLEPTRKRFSVVFEKDDFSSPERQESFEVFYKEKGWKKEIQWKEMKIFSTDTEEVPVEIDEEIKLENTHKFMRKTFVSNWLKVLLFMLVLGFSNGMNYFIKSPYSDGKTIWAFFISLYGALIAGLSLFGYMFWLKVSRKKTSEGKKVISFAWYRKILIVLIIGFLATFFASSQIQFGQGLLLYIIISTIVILATILCINYFSQIIEEKKSSVIFQILSNIVIIILIFIAAIIIKGLRAFII